MMPPNKLKIGVKNPITINRKGFNIFEETPYLIKKLKKHKIKETDLILKGVPKQLLELLKENTNYRRKKTISNYYNIYCSKYKNQYCFFLYSGKSIYLNYDST